MRSAQRGQVTRERSSDSEHASDLRWSPRARKPVRAWIVCPPNMGGTQNVTVYRNQVVADLMNEDKVILRWGGPRIP